MPTYKFDLKDTAHSLNLSLLLKSLIFAIQQLSGACYKFFCPKYEGV